MTDAGEGEAPSLVFAAESLLVTASRGDGTVGITWLDLDGQPRQTIFVEAAALRDRLDEVVDDSPGETDEDDEEGEEEVADASQ